MPKKLTATEASRNFSDVLARVHHRGESFLLTRHGRVIAQLVPPEPGKVVRLGELAQVLDELPRLDPTDAAHFGRNIDTARARLKAPRDPWAS